MNKSIFTAIFQALIKTIGLCAIIIAGVYFEVTVLNKLFEHVRITPLQIKVAIVVLLFVIVFVVNYIQERR